MLFILGCVFGEWVRVGHMLTGAASAFLPLGVPPLPASVFYAPLLMWRFATQDQGVTRIR